MHGCLGRDGTVLFDRYHSWVNLEGLIGPLLLGYVQIEKKSGKDDDEGSGGYLKGKVGGTTNSGDEGASGDHIVLPTSSSSANAATFSAETTQATVEFAMPKPRPPKGSVVPSLLGASDGNNNEEKEEELL